MQLSKEFKSAHSEATQKLNLLHGFECRIHFFRFFLPIIIHFSEFKTSNATRALNAFAKATKSHNQPDCRYKLNSFVKSIYS